MQTRCLTEAELRALQVGDLPEADLDAATEHLEQCAVCEDAARRLDTLTDAGAERFRVSTPAETPKPPGAVAGHEILEEIGRGGMGVVYRARHVRLGRVVALKMLLGPAFAGRDEVARFRAEAEAAARLHHPNIVQVYEVGEVDDGMGSTRPFFTMEFVDGGSLSERIAGKPQSPDQAAGWLESLARAVQYAHTQGIIHRDLKPSNVLLTKAGEPKVCDFGVAKRVGQADGRTRTGLVVGTVEYMAPEQARGEAVGPSADVYALGAVLYVALTGRPPFRGKDLFDLLQRVQVEEPAAPSRLAHAVPRDLETICLKCLRKEPTGRFASAADLAEDLRRFRAAEPILAQPVSSLGRFIKWTRRRPFEAALLAVLALSLVLGSAGSTYFGITAGKRADDAHRALSKEADATEAQRWESYVANIGSAAGALQLHNVEPARRALQAAPERFRNWEWRHFNSQLEGSRQVLRGGGAANGFFSFSADGRRLAATTNDPPGTYAIRVWDLVDGKEQRVLRVAGGHLWDGAFSPVDDRLATGGDRLRVWNATTGELLWEEPGERKAFRPLWSADGCYVAVSAESRPHLFDARTGREPFQTAARAANVSYAFSPDGKHFAAGDVATGPAGKPEYTARVWEIATGSVAAKLLGHQHVVTAIAYSPDGRRIATAGDFPECTVRVWDAATGRSLGQGKGHVNWIGKLAFSPDGRTLASGATDQTARLWDGETAAPRHVLEGHTDRVSDLTFSPDGRWLVTASGDQTLRLWDRESGSPATALLGHAAAVSNVAYAPGGRTLVSSSNDGTLRLWDAEIAPRSGVISGHERFVYDVAFRPDGNEVASVAWDGTARRWDPATGRQTDIVRQSAEEVGIVTSVAYSPDGRRLAVASREEGVCLWDRGATAPVHRWDVAPNATTSDTRIAYHPDGRLIAWGTAEGPIRLLNAATGGEEPPLLGHTQKVEQVAFRPDGRQLASFSGDGRLYLWDVPSRRITDELKVPTDSRGLAYSPDGRLLAAGGESRVVKLWRVDPPQELGELPLGSTIYGLAFNADGSRLACACIDNTIRLWDVERRREVAELRGHRAYVYAVQFSPDGSRLASASGDRTVRIWDTLSMQERAAAPRQ